MFTNYYSKTHLLEFMIFSDNLLYNLSLRHLLNSNSFCILQYTFYSLLLIFHVAIFIHATNFYTIFFA